ncbi:MAG: AAA family ATPase, partial [Christensenellaceae bacterium]
MAISKAPSSQFVCTECGYAAPKWLGKCPGCGNFNTMQEELVKPAESAKRSSRPALSDMGGGTRAVPLSKVGYEKFKRISSGIGEFDTVLGGGIVRGSLVLLGGDPGIGKSTLLTQVSAHLAQDRPVLYVSAEESCSQVKMRCERLGLDSDNLLLLNETCLEDIEASLSDAEFVVIDSVQAIYTEALSSAAGSVGQVRECAARLMRIAKSRGITFFIIGHVTKEGALAGPKVLEHIM